MHLTEDILHFVWRHGLFDQDDLKTEDGQSLQLIHRGIHNHHSGPDFMEAKIKIGNTVWAGQVELHVHSGDWFLHQHEKDRAYDNVILHVVYFDDKEVAIRGQKLPVLVLNGRIPPLLFEKYRKLLEKKNEIPCSYGLVTLKETVKISQIERSLVERLERKADRILEILFSLQNDWEETAFRCIAIQMIGKLNEQPMIWLLEEIRLKQLRNKSKDSIHKESVLFGLAGMLKQVSDDYSEKLSKEFNFQKHKYGYREIDVHLWRYGRMRPANFPSLRIAQLVAILKKNESIFETLMNSESEAIVHDFWDIKADSYWETHHQFGKSIKKRSVSIGKMQKDLLIINVIAPLFFAYGKYHQDEIWKMKAADLLMKLKPEENHIMRKWSESGMKAESAFDSQGLIELYNNSCIPKKCLSCIIGTSLLKS